MGVFEATVIFSFLFSCFELNHTGPTPSLPMSPGQSTAGLPLGEGSLMARTGSNRTQVND